jgi:hypothetical protein
VGSIRFEDYYAEEEYLCKLLDISRFSEADRRAAAAMHQSGKRFRVGSAEKDDWKCTGCVFRCHNWKIGMTDTCFEVKITCSDFRSANGHNFHSNENYYCLPKALVPKIAGEIPDDIGILAYYEGERQYGPRRFKPSG